MSFTDAQGNARTVDHTSDTFRCFRDYHAGDVITIRYVPSDPSLLLTQEEMGELGWAAIWYVLVDILFIITPLAALVTVGVSRARKRLAASLAPPSAGA